jgi:FMN phosphatase YigB (HAD superfamily)
MIKTILFDMGNVLVRFNHTKMVMQLSELFKAQENKVEGLVFNGLGELSDSGKITPREIHSRLCQEFGVNPGFEDFRKAWSDIFSKMPGSEALVRSLKGRYRLILASNTNEMHFQNVQENFPFISLLENASSYILGISKPELISRILERFSLKPGECAFIDDIGDYTDHARALGIRAIHFESLEQARKEISRF